MRERDLSDCVMLISNTSFDLVHFRGNLIRALVAAGYRVMAAAPEDSYTSAVRELPVAYIRLPFAPAGTSMQSDARLLAKLVRLLWRERPSAVLTFTIKPNIYASLACALLKIPVINTVTGLGSPFIQRNWRTIAVKLLYRIALRRSKLVLFHNVEDLQDFARLRITGRAPAERIWGSGVDIQRFSLQPLPSSGCNFLMIGRLTREKGVQEYADAAALIRDACPQAECSLAGFEGLDNPSAIPESEVQRWAARGDIHYLGHRVDVRPLIAEAHCVVLPSWREGLPRSLLEAAAMGRPIIASDVPGCRDLVTHGLNGFLCRPRAAADLAKAMIAFYNLQPTQRAVMGLASRRMAETLVDDRQVIERYIRAVEALLHAPKPLNLQDRR